jgi:hypothetical protein
MFLYRDGKEGQTNRLPFFVSNLVGRDLFLNGCLNRTYACASAAAQTFISVDYILAVLLNDGRDGAGIDASAAIQTLILIDLVSHFVYLHRKLLSYAQQASLAYSKFKPKFSLRVHYNIDKRKNQLLFSVF